MADRSPSAIAQPNRPLAAIIGLHLLGFVILLALVAPHEYSLAGGSGFGVGLGVTAYTLGLRHAFDYISAIDDTTRKLMAEGQRPLSADFFFALGHATIVFALGALVVFGVRGLGGALEDRGLSLRAATGVVGPLVSGGFLILIGLLNLAIPVNVLGIFRRLGGGEYDEAELERQIDSRGLMNRINGRATRAVRKPRQMYPLGALSVLGFDTATEVALLVLAGGAAASGSGEKADVDRAADPDGIDSGGVPPAARGVPDRRRRRARRDRCPLYSAGNATGGSEEAAKFER